MASITLKNKASYDLPEFIREDFKTFAAFLDSYHEWLELYQADIKNIVDIDTTLEQFVINFKKEINYKNMQFPHIDEKFLLRHIKQLYLSKGTEESYITLFKMLYNKDITIKYPEEMTLKLSDGKWEQINSIFLSRISGDVSNITNKVCKLHSTTTNSIIELEIESVKTRRTGSSLSRITLSNGGSGYTNPTISFNGTGTMAAAHPVVSNGLVTSILVDNAGSGYPTPTITITDSGSGSGAIAHAILENGKITNIIVDNQGVNYNIPTITFSGAGGTNAVAMANVVGGKIISINVINGGAGYITPTVIFGSGGIGLFTVNMSGATVASVTVVNGGTNYAPNSSLAVTFSGGNATTQATGTATTNGSGVITSIAVNTPGANYISTPSIVVYGGGTHAVAKTTTKNGVISGISITKQGYNYRTAPTITFGNVGNGINAAAHSVITNGIITSIIVDNPGFNYTSPPIVTIAGSHTTEAIIKTVGMYDMPDIYECNINRNYYGKIEIGDKLICDQFSGVVLPTINSAKITNPGNNFKLGQTFNIDTMFGSGTIAKVSKLTASKGLAELDFIKFGYGYISDFISSNLIPSNNTAVSNIVGFGGATGNGAGWLYPGTFTEYSKISPSGGYILNETYSIAPSVDNPYSYNHTWASTTNYAAGEILRVNTTFYKVTTAGITSGSAPVHTAGSVSNGSTILQYLDSQIYVLDYVGDLVREFYSSNQYNGNIANAATVEFKLGAVCKYRGQYINSDGLLSDDNKIQDNFFYQKYSYVIQVDEKLETYKDAVKSFLHPAGMALFGEYSIQNNFNLQLKLNALMSIFEIKHADSYRIIDTSFAYTKLHTINDGINNAYGIGLDNAVIQQTNYVYDIDMPILDPNDFVSESDSNYFLGNFVHSETSNVTETAPIYTLSTFLSDTANIQEYTSITMGDAFGGGLILFDTLYPSDINNIIGVSLAKGTLDETIFYTTSGSVILNLYVDQSYVQAGYVSGTDQTF